MSADLERMFASMRTDSDGATMPAPVALRGRGDRRTRARAVAGLIAVVLVVGGTTIGARQLLAGPVTPPPPITDTTPAPTGSAAPSPTGSTSPQPDQSPEPTDVAVPPDPTGSPVQLPGCDEISVLPYRGPDHAGEALPASLMLRAGDWGKCYVMSADRPGYPVYRPGEGPAPDICLDQAAYRADADRVAGRFRQFTGGPEIGGFESVTRYRPGVAAKFVEEIRVRVERCATFTPKDMPGPWQARIVRQNFTGDESLLIYVGAVGTNYPGWYLGVARRGDLVVVVEPHADLGGSRDHTTAMTRRAIGRL
jgi:hypothetical protein